jgi:hypothetical protein
VHTVNAGNTKVGPRSRQLIPGECSFGAAAGPMKSQIGPAQMAGPLDEDTGRESGV